jgi:hypothetical protein
MQTSDMSGAIQAGHTSDRDFLRDAPEGQYRIGGSGGLRSVENRGDNRRQPVGRCEATVCPSAGCNVRQSDPAAIHDIRERLFGF